MPDADARQRSHQLERHIAAPVREIFAAIESPALLARWWGPDCFSSAFEQFDFCTGGEWKLTMHGPDGTDYWNESRFLAVVPMTKVEIEHLGDHHFVLVIELAETDGGTLVKWTQTFDTSEEFAQVRSIVTAANAQNLDRLTAVVKGTCP